MRKNLLIGLGVFCLANLGGGIVWLAEKQIFLLAALGVLLASFAGRPKERGLLFVVICLTLGLLNGQRMVDPNGRLIIVQKHPGALEGAVLPGSWQNTADGVSFTLAVTDGNRGQVRVFWKTGKPEDERRLSGGRVSAQGVLHPPRYFHNPGMLDWEWIRSRQNEAGTLSATSAPRLTSGGSPPVWRGWLWDVRQSFKQKLTAAMPAKDAALLENMLFGGYAGLDQDTVRDFTRTGLVHILSVSGSHVALVAATGGWLCKRAGLAVRSSAVILGVLVWSYVLFSGLVVPAVRSALMGSLVLVGNVLGRAPDSALGLVSLATLFLAVTPSLVIDMSFLLSFGSTAGLLVLAPVIADRLKSWPPIAALPLAVAVGSQLAVAPLLLAFSHQLPLASLAANLFFTPLAEAAMTVALVGLLTPFVGSLLLVAASLMLGAVTRGLAWLASHPLAAVPVHWAPLWSMTLYYVALFAFFYAAKADNEEKSSCRWHCVAVISFSAWLTFLTPLFNPDFAVYFLDVGQGNAAMVLTPGGRTILIDSGSREMGDTGRRVVAPVLSGMGASNLDLLLLTHGHDDHAGGALSVAAEHPVLETWFPSNDFSPAIEQLLIVHPPAKTVRVTGGEKAVLDGVAIEVVYVDTVADGNNENEHSAFYLISYLGRRFLFTGDAPAEQELAAMRHLPSVAVLQVAHHGSNTSSDPAFLAACQPACAVISVGQDNRFGHPAPGVLKRLRKQGCSILRTDQNGAVGFEERDGQWQVKTFR